MRVDTLQYKYQMNAPISRVYQSIYLEQLTFFQTNDTQIVQLTEGTQISRNFVTKTQRLPVPGTIKITSLIKNKILQMETAYASGTILQTYELREHSTGKTKVVYSEKNTFTEMRHQYSFIAVGLLYKLSYNNGIKKRMRYIEKLAQQIL